MWWWTPRGWFWRDDHRRNRFFGGKHNRLVNRMYRRGLPCRISFNRSGNLWSLTIQPRRGFTHLKPMNDVQRDRRKGWKLHITVAMADQVRNAPRSDGVYHALGFVKKHFERPRNITLQVVYVGSNYVVHVRHPVFNPVIQNLRFLREWYSAHQYAGDPTISM